VHITWRIKAAVGAIVVASAATIGLATASGTTNTGIPPAPGATATYTVTVNSSPYYGVKP